jgi:hypothetical protein
MPKPTRLEYAAAFLLGPNYGLDPWTARTWPGVGDLTSEDRNAAIRATRRGADVGEARLAPAVIGYSHALHATRDRFLRWHDSVIVGGFAFLAFILSARDWSPSLAFPAGLMTAIAFFLISGLWGLRRTLAKAECAETSARKLLEQPVVDDD